MRHLVDFLTHINFSFVQNVLIVGQSSADCQASLVSTLWPAKIKSFTVRVAFREMGGCDRILRNSRFSCTADGSLDFWLFEGGTTDITLPWATLSGVQPINRSTCFKVRNNVMVGFQGPLV